MMSDDTNTCLILWSTRPQVQDWARRKSSLPPWFSSVLSILSCRIRTLVNQGDCTLGSQPPCWTVCYALMSQLALFGLIFPILTFSDRTRRGHLR